MQEGKIHKAIIGIMSEIGAIGKEKKNQQQGFMYRGVDDVMNALQPLLVKHGVFVAPEIMEHAREERTTQKGGTLLYSICKIRYTFYADDGSHIEAVVIGEGMDSGDKATNKAMAIAFKYACFQVFCIPTEEMADPDAATPEQTKPKSTPKAPPPTAPDKPKSIPKNTPMDKEKWDGFWKGAGIEGWTQEEVAEFAQQDIGAFNMGQVAELWKQMQVYRKRQREAQNA